jgi:hypothetical protein
MTEMVSQHEFYEMIGGAAATLLGLLFVSMSMNAEIILGPDHRHSRNLAEQAFRNYLAVLFLSLLTFFPHVTAESFGYTLLSVIAIWGSWAVIRAYQSMTMRDARESRVTILRRYVPSVAGYAAIACGGVLMITGGGYYDGLIAVGVMLLLISATILSWDLLVNIAEEKYGHRK